VTSKRHIRGLIATHSVGLSMIHPQTKFEMPVFNNHGDMKENAKCGINGMIWGG